MLHFWCGVFEDWVLLIHPVKMYYFMAEGYGKWRGKMTKDLTLLEEIAEQDLKQVNGGTIDFAVKAGKAAAGYARDAYRVGSIVLGNGGGAVCTATIECQQICE